MLPICMLSRNQRFVTPLPAINFVDDLIDPPELGMLESQVKRDRAILIPKGDKTSGHCMHPSGKTTWPTS